MTKWQTKRLGDFVMFQRGFDLLAKDRTDGNIPVISSSGITGFHNQFKAKGEGVIIGRKGTLGTVHYSEQDYWPHDTTLWITDFKGNLPRFIYYFLPLLQLKKYDVGSSNPTLNRNYIHEIIATLPPLEEQQKIAAVLSALDAKIELNNRINAELENLAKTIYDYWFVQFDFPDRNGKPYKSSGGEMIYNKECDRAIPAGWEVKRLGEILTIVRGASPRPIDDFLSEKGLPWIKISDATSSNNRFITETKQFIIEKGIPNTRHIQPDTLILSNSATLGLPRIVKISAGVHDGWLIISNYTNGLTQEFMYHYFSYEYLRIVCLGNGSIFKNLKTDYVKGLKIVLPPKYLLDKASAKFKAISELIYARTKENQQLTQLRDWLLPMLMNGQISIK